jgi:hypothetical protein
VLNKLRNLKANKKLLLITASILLIISIIAGVYFIRQGNFDLNTSADQNLSSVRMQLSFGNNSDNGNGARLTAAKLADVKNVISNTKYSEVKINIDKLDYIAGKSVLRVIYPVSSAGIGQYGWTMTKPNKDQINATSSKGVKFSTTVGDLNQDWVLSIPYLDLKPLQNITPSDSVTVTLKDVTSQSLPINNNIFQVFIDRYGSNNFQKLGDLSFNVFSKPADSVKVFVDNTYSPNQNIAVNVTPVFSGDVGLYRYPANDELYEGNMTLRVGSGSTSSVIWPDGTSSSTKPEYTFASKRLSANCVRNCTTNIINIKSPNTGFFYLEGKIPGENYDGSFSVSNPTSNVLLQGTPYANKKLSFGDWHSHYNDTKSNLPDNINYGKLGYKSEFIGATNKTFYDAYPQYKQITQNDFNQYLALNKQFNKDGSFLAIPNEEWPKVISYSNPYRDSLSSTVANDTSKFLSYVWIHQMLLFRSEEKSGFFSTDTVETSNFFNLIKEAEKLDAVMIPHHLGSYAWDFYDSNTQAAARVTAFNTYEAGNDPAYGLPKILLQGAKIGVVGESDSHQGTSAEGGLTGVYTDQLNRDQLLNAVERRDTFATTSFGKPQIYFALTGPQPAEMGKEAVIDPNQKPTFKIKVLMSKQVKQIVIRRGSYGGTNFQDVNLDLVKDCKNTNGRYLDCTWTETSNEKFNFYYVTSGSNQVCTGNNQILLSEHCLWSSPIWISRSDVNSIIGDNFNNVADQGKEVNIKTRFLVTPGKNPSNVENMAIYMGNEHPNQAYNINSFKLSGGEGTNLDNNNWFNTKTSKPSAAVDFKVRNVNGALVFAGFDNAKLLAGKCNPNDDSCIMATAKAGEAKSLYINTDGTYTTNKIACTSSNTNKCSYASLNAGKSSIVKGKYDAFAADIYDITWNITFEPQVGERIYELYTNGFSTGTTAQGWRRVGSILANPTIPGGTFSAVNQTSADDGTITLKVQNQFTDNANGVKGIGNIYFKVTDVGANEQCSFVSEDWYSTYALVNSLGSQFKYKLKGENGQRKICYYFKDIYGLQNRTQELIVTKKVPGAR